MFRRGLRSAGQRKQGGEGHWRQHKGAGVDEAGFEGWWVGEEAEEGMRRCCREGSRDRGSSQTHALNPLSDLGADSVPLTRPSTARGGLLGVLRKFPP